MSALHMPAGQPSSQPVPDDRPDVPPHEEVRRERPAPRSRSPQLSSLDRLAIGAPLTAAMIGALFAEAGRADAGADAASASDDAILPVRPGAAAPDQTATTGHSPVPAASEGAGEGVATAAAGAGITPVEADAPAGSSPAQATVADLPPTAAAMPGDLTAAADAPATIIAGPEISITLAGGGTAGAYDPGTGPGTGATPGEGGDIGTHVPGGPGDDVIHGTDANDVLSGGAGDDEIHGHAGDDLIDGGAGDDLLFGGAGDDRVLGGAGNDQIHGGVGNDQLLGGTGNDLLFGEAGRDFLDGGAGHDRLDGGTGADQMAGGAGNDVLVIGEVNDVALETTRSPDGGGVDTVQIADSFAADLAAVFGVNSATFRLADDVDQLLPEGVSTFEQQLDPDIEHVILTGSADHDVVGNGGDNRITGNDGDNVLNGRNGDDILSGGAGNDLLDGGKGQDRLDGGSGNDILAGGHGADDLYGGAGNDLLDGGAGADRLFGQGGDDTFVIGLNDNAVDTVFDHQGANQLVITDGHGHLVETAIAGRDLYVVVDKNPVAVVEDFDPGSFIGLDAGSGSLGLNSLLAQNAGNGPALGQSASSVGFTASSSADLLEPYLTAPSHYGSATGGLLSGTSSNDWLSGLDGDDLISGGAGRDILEGGAGSDLLSGGLGDDRYLFRSSESGLDIIRDADGSNFAELYGFTGARLEGVMVGSDLVVVAHHAPIFKVENFLGHEDSFLGIRNGDEFITTDDLFA